MHAEIHVFISGNARAGERKKKINIIKG